ncbi:MAG: CoA ester lyase [Alphaproteobacteria bacterium]|nr:CoA ester lyase [Alphaproteobacteria bacterium]
MNEAIRPRRGVLYMPASRAGALEKARALPADGLIFDLEDAVSPDSKELARAQAVAACRSGAYGRRELIVRVNGLNTPWGYGDLAAVAASGADAVLLPKVEDAALIGQADEILRAHGAPSGLAIWAMVETPLAMLRVDDVARAGRLSVLVMGTSDLAKELHAAHTPLRLPFVTGLGLALLAARAYGLGILDGVHLDLDDAAGFEAECRQGLEFGFDGKTLIHPKQIEPCNRVFAPSSADVAWAERVIAAHAAALAEGKGVVLLDGRLIENLHVEGARRVRALAAAIRALAH